MQHLIDKGLIRDVMLRLGTRCRPLRELRRRTVFDAIQSQLTGPADNALNPTWTLGRLDQHDPVFAARSEIGLG